MSFDQAIILLIASGLTLLVGIWMMIRRVIPMRDDGLLTVESLIKILGRFDPERVVIISKDAEGNEFSPLSEITTAAYRPLRSWVGEIGIEELTEELEEFGYTEGDVKGGIPCIILEPIN